MRPSRIIPIAAAVMVAAAAAWAGPPQRVVSMNLCTDQLALLVAAPGQVISVSVLAADPMTSSMPEAAAALPLNRGRAEEIYLMRPDLVLAGTFSDPATIDMLGRLGVRVERFPIVRTLDEIPDQIRRMGVVLGRGARAEDLIADFNTRLAALAPSGGIAPTAAIFQANGYSQGAGTLTDDILAHSGFVNLATRLGRTGGTTLSLEEVVVADPDLLVMSTPYPANSRAEEIMFHPALGVLRANRAPAHTSPDWTCGTPHVLNAVAAMAERRKEIFSDE